MMCAVVLGAGASTRMGVQKLLLPWAGRTVIEHIVDQLLASVIDHVLVVTGHDHQRLDRILAHSPVALLYNDQHAEGMLSSVRCGLKALPEACTGVLVALGDQPALKVSTVNLLLERYRQHPKIIVPVYQGQRGHPLVFSPAYVQEILTQYDDTGLRALLKTYEEDILEVAIDSPDILWDLDTPEDYQRQIKSTR